MHSEKFNVITSLIVGGATNISAPLASMAYPLVYPSSPSSMILLAVVLGVVLLVASYVFRTVRQQWAIITALRQVPCDPEQHWLWGHKPKVSRACKNKPYLLILGM